MKASAGSRRRAGWLLGLALLLFIALVVYLSLPAAGRYRCEICMTFRGATVCRTVEGATEHDAHEGAVTNACAQLAGGVTDTLACSRTEPTSLHCAPLH